MIVIETERLILRHLALDDLDALAAMYADPQFMRFLGDLRTREETRSGIECWQRQYETRGYGFYATVLKEEDRLIGRCGLLHQTIDGAAAVEVAYGLSPAYWGRGLATEAARAIKNYGFQQFGFPRLISIIDPENFASQRVAEKNGMQRERQFLFEGYPCCLYGVENPATESVASRVSE